MCITRFPARLSNTIIYAAEAQRNGEVFHVIGYQNEVKAKGEPNAMILPLPAAGPLGPENVVDTRKFRDILGAYDKAVERLRPRSRSLSRGVDSLTAGVAGRGFQVFESGSYTIALAEKPSAMRLALSKVPAEKRPEIPVSFLASLSHLYKDWPIAICCFAGSLKSPEPLLWWFKPRFDRVLFAPAIDAHDGNPPDPNVRVERDHTLAFASYRSHRAHDHALIEDIAEVPLEHQWMFLPSVVGTKIERMTGNGDFSLPISAVLDEQVAAWLPNLDITPPPKDLPTRYEHILAGGALA